MALTSNQREYRKGGRMQNEGATRTATYRHFPLGDENRSVRSSHSDSGVAAAQRGLHRILFGDRHRQKEISDRRLQVQR